MTFGVALAALALSAWNFWVSQVRRGNAYLSRPTIFFFGWDRQKEDIPKIMFRSALFTSGNRGRIVESIHVFVKTIDGRFAFPFWGYDDGKGMVRGSGLYVGTTGHIAYHHFNPIHDDDRFSYSGESYEIEVWAKLFAKSDDVLLGRYEFHLNDKAMALSLAEHQIGILWNWSPSERKYYPEASQRPFE